MEQRLIDANELRKNLSSRYMNELYPDWRTLPELTKMRIEMLAKEFRFALDHAPTIDAVPVVHGRWILVSKGNFSPGGFEIEEKCSECGRYVYRYEDQPQDNYCPNCGAKMDAKE